MLYAIVSGCRGSYGNDVAFIVDSSAKSNSYYSWSSLASFVSSVYRYSYAYGNTWVSLVRYDEDVHVEKYPEYEYYYWYDDYSDTDVSSSGSESDLAKALDVVRIDILSPSLTRSNVWQVAVVITDKLPSLLAAPELESAIIETKSAGIKIVAVGLQNNETDELDLDTLDFLGAHGLTNLAISYDGNRPVDTNTAFQRQVGNLAGFCTARAAYGEFLQQIICITIKKNM